MFIFCVFTGHFSVPCYSSGFILYLRRLAECVCSLSVCHHKLGRRYYTVCESEAAQLLAHRVILFVLFMYFCGEVVLKSHLLVFVKDILLLPGSPDNA